MKKRGAILHRKERDTSRGSPRSRVAQKAIARDDTSSSAIGQVLRTDLVVVVPRGRTGTATALYPASVARDRASGSFPQQLRLRAPGLRIQRAGRPVHGSGSAKSPLAWGQRSVC